MDTEAGYNPNPITSSILYSKPVGSIDWRLVSDASSFSLCTGNVSLSREYGIIGLADALKSNELVNQIPETDPVLSLLPAKETKESECDDEEYEIEGEEHKISVASGRQDEEKEDDGDDVKEFIQDDTSICCSDRSINSISSFTFPILHNEDGSVKTPTMETRWNVFDKPLELSQPQTQPHPQFYFIPAPHKLTHLPPQRRSSLSRQASETQSQKAFRNRWFSCFHRPL